MNILVTGAAGFIGKHVSLWLSRHDHNVFKYDLGSSEEELIEYISKCDFLFDYLNF